TADFPAHRRTLCIGKIGLPQTIHEPLKAVPRGVVCLIPGWSGTRSGPADILTFLADELAGAGFKAVRTDLPGRGDADGEFSACDLDTMIAAASATLLEQAIAGTPKYLLGMCSGGNVALGA